MPEIQIIFEDQDILGINKPAGFLSIPDGYNPQLPHLLSALEPEFGKLWVVHRLDRDTSGVMILARNKVAHKYLNLQFASRVIKKEYQAIVIGLPGWKEKTVTLPLLVDGDRQHRTIISNNGKPASTTLLIGGCGENFTFLFIYPYNGYTHQIRAHLAAINHPILSDFLYQRKKEAPPTEYQTAIIPRTALHAASIQFPHPVSNERITLQSPIPKDFLLATTACGIKEISRPPLPDWL